MQLNSTTIAQLSYQRRASSSTATRLWFDNQDIMSIEPGVFNRYKLLQELHLKGNKIEELPQGIFHYMRELRVINISENRVSSLHPQLFQRNMKLEVIYVNNNDLTELNEKDLFLNLPELQLLLFSGNKIKTFNFEYLKGSTKLGELCFHDNDLREITELENLKKFFPKLRQVDVRGNNFSCSYMQRVVQSLAQQNIRIYELEISKGIQLDSVYGLKCIPDDLYLFSLSEGRKVESKESELEARLKQLKAENTKLRGELNNSNGKINGLEAALALHQQQNRELNEDRKETELEMWQAIQELQRQQARSKPN